MTISLNKITYMAFDTLCITYYIFVNSSICTRSVHVYLTVGYYLGETEAHQIRERRSANICIIVGFYHLIIGL